MTDHVVEPFGDLFISLALEVFSELSPELQQDLICLLQCLSSPE